MPRTCNYICLWEPACKAGVETISIPYWGKPLLRRFTRPPTISKKIQSTYGLRAWHCCRNGRWLCMRWRKILRRGLAPSSTSSTSLMSCSCDGRRTQIPRGLSCLERQMSTTRCSPLATKSTQVGNETRVTYTSKYDISFWSTSDLAKITREATRRWIICTLYLGGRKLMNQSPQWS